MLGLAARDRRVPGRRCHLEFPGFRSALVPLPGAATLSQQSTPWKHPLVTLSRRLETFGNQTGSLLPPKQGGQNESQMGDRQNLPLGEDCS